MKSVTGSLAGAASILILASVLVGQPAAMPGLEFVATSKFHLPKAPVLSAEPRALPQIISSKTYSPEYAQRELVEGIGGGITAGEVDGHKYLYVATGGWNALLRDNGDGTFEDVTARAGVATRNTVLSATFTDYDRSGHVSLLLAGAGGVILYRNQGNGSFTDYTRRAGLPQIPSSVCTRAVLSDFDGDGFPDLVLAMYTDLSRPPAKPEFTFPDDFPGAVTRLYRNNGKGVFQDVTEQSGLGGNLGRARTAIVSDFNHDQHPDLLILHDDRPPALFFNRGDGNFTETTWQAGDEFTGHAFFDGAAVDFNHDGAPDLALWSAVSFRVLLNTGNGRFKEAKMPRIPPHPTSFGFHGSAGDFDGDGLPDLLTVDSQGSWRLLHNQGGGLTEIPLSIKPQSAANASRAITLIDAQDGPYLWTVGANSRISVFRPKTPATK